MAEKAQREKGWQYEECECGQQKRRHSDHCLACYREKVKEGGPKKHVQMNQTAINYLRVKI